MNNITLNLDRRRITTRNSFFLKPQIQIKRFIFAFELNEFKID